MIDWHAFDWPTFGALAQAGSGLLVGILAVRGAVTVGLKQAAITQRQADIADRQTKILERQVDLERRSLDSNLYDRRYEIYDAAAQFLVETSIGSDLKPDGATERRFLIAMAESRFLYRIEVHEALLEVSKKVYALYSLRKRMAHDLKSKGVYADGDPELEHAKHDWIHDRIDTLHSLFPELVLA